MPRMTRQQRRQEALWRFHVIAPLLPLQGTDRAAKISTILASPPAHPFGEQPPLSERTIYRWIHDYETASGDRLQALELKVRKDCGRSRVVPPELLAQVTTLRENAPRLSVHEILKRVDHPAREQVSRRAVARALLAAGYDLKDKRRRIADRHRGPKAEVDWDLLRWEADFPNEVWQVDSTPAIWLPAGPHRERPVQLQLVNIIDDNSRLVVGGGFTERLAVADLLRFLMPAIGLYGCPSMLFADQAKIHKSAIVAEGVARLGGTVVLGTVAHAPGHGKVEAMHQRQQNSLLEDFHLSPVDTCEQANAAYRLWCERYADEVHGETDETPRSRWARIAGNARIPSEEELRWAFRGTEERLISELGEIQLFGQVYEAPPSHRQARPIRVTIRYDLLDRSEIWIEDPDGTRHRCPIYRVRSHTERREHRDSAGPGLSFANLNQ